MKTGLRQILLRVAGTIVLLAGFIVLIAKTPFMHESPGGPDRAQQVAVAEGLRWPGTGIDTGAYALSGNGSPGRDAGAIASPTLGLFKAQFGQSANNPGFSTEERRVSGGCADAGRRYAEEACADCQIIAGDSQPGVPGTLMWTQLDGEAATVYSVTTDCTEVDAEGGSIVGVLRFGGEQLDLSRRSGELALDRVPLLPGAVRLAAVELGPWLATFDEISQPSTALEQLTRIMRQRGWRDAPSETRDSLQTFEGDRVLINAENAFCVISLKQQGDEHQLLTIISAQAQG